jgi:hypothetical protein
MDDRGIGFEDLDWTHLDEVCPVAGCVKAKRPLEGGSGYV